MGAAKLKLSPKVQKNELFCWRENATKFHITKKLIFWVLETILGLRVEGGRQLKIVSERQNMSFFYFASIP